MIAPFGIVLIIAIVCMLYLYFRRSTPRRMFTIIFVGYFSFLLCSLVVSEFLEINTKSYSPQQIESPTDFVIHDKIINKEKIEPSVFIEKRIYKTDNTLLIENEDNRVIVYIERLDGQLQTIEEFLYKPALIINYHNFSDRIKFNKPFWDGNKIIIPEQPSNNINYVSYNDAELTNQFIKDDQPLDCCYYPIWSPLVVHLKVPENIEVISSNEELTYFIDE